MLQNFKFRAQKWCRILVNQGQSHHVNSSDGGSLIIEQNHLAMNSISEAHCRLCELQFRVVTSEPPAVEGDNAVDVLPAGTDAIAEFTRDKMRRYFRCPRCALVFVPDAFVVLPEREKQEYDLHDNNFQDAGYRKFLSRALQPLMSSQRTRVWCRPSEALTAVSRPLAALDFGCGPAPVLAEMLRELLIEGSSVDVYDKFYANDPLVLEGVERYDLITATEVVEHLHEAGNTLHMLWRLLRTGGLMILMTKRVSTREKFDTWHYKRDPTHISFFSETTFQWMTDSNFLTCSRMTLEGADVVVFEKVG